MSFFGSLIIPVHDCGCNIKNNFINQRTFFVIVKFHMKRFFSFILLWHFYFNLLFSGRKMNLKQVFYILLKIDDKFITATDIQTSRHISCIAHKHLYLLNTLYFDVHLSVGFIYLTYYDLKSSILSLMYI